MATKNSKKKPVKRQPESEEMTSYDEWKFYEGEFYKGMKIGRSHKWYYDKGVWKDKKITPDLWQINYAVTKRRAGKAPEGSGVPVGTEYHWYIVCHQMVKKLNANDYTTSIAGLKYKVAHKRADTLKWSATPKTQRKRMIKFLYSIIEDLEEQEAAELIQAEISKNNKHLKNKKPGSKAAAGKKLSNAEKNGSAGKKSTTGAKKGASRNAGARKTSTVRQKQRQHN